MSAKECATRCLAGDGLHTDRFTQKKAFCQYCNGESCWPVTQVPRCLAPNAMSEAECAAVRGQWVQHEHRCQYVGCRRFASTAAYAEHRYIGITTLEECLEGQHAAGKNTFPSSPPFCPASRQVRIQSGRYTLCESFCYDQSRSGNPGLCDGGKVHSTTKYGRPVFQVYDELSHTCRIWSRGQRYEGAHGCVHYLGGTWFGGRLFDQGQYATQESCERGMCGWDEFGHHQWWLEAGDAAAAVTRPASVCALRAQCSASCQQCRPRIPGLAMCSSPGLSTPYVRRRASPVNVE